MYMRFVRAGRWWGWIAALLVGATSHLRAQASSSGDIQQTLPVPRKLGDVPQVPNVGVVSVRGDSVAMLARMPKLAIGDMNYYTATLGSFYPLSVAHFPADSIEGAKLARAQAWFTQLRAAGVPDPDGTQALMLAEAAINAGMDSMAQRIIKEQFAAARTPVRRSAVLAAGIDLFTDVVSDSARYVARIAVAEVYGTELARMRLVSYATHRDSVNVLYRQVAALIRLTTASCGLGRLATTLRYTDQAIALSSRLGLNERPSMFAWYFPMQELAELLLAQPRGRAILDTNSQIRNVLAIAPQLTNALARAKLIGQPAPVLLANTWLNTPDSLYTPTPRAHDFADHAVHLVAFGYAGNVAILERLHQRFPTLHLLLMNETVGRIGSEIVDEDTEIKWWHTFLRDRRHATMPIGIWVGSRVPNKFGGSAPARGVNSAAYRAEGNWCTLVDRRGIVRHIVQIGSRPDEERVAKLLATMLGAEPERQAGSQ